MSPKLEPSLTPLEGGIVLRHQAVRRLGRCYKRIKNIRTKFSQKLFSQNVESFLEDKTKKDEFIKVSQTGRKKIGTNFFCPNEPKSFWDLLDESPQ